MESAPLPRADVIARTLECYQDRLSPDMAKSRGGKEQGSQISLKRCLYAAYIFSFPARIFGMK